MQTPNQPKFALPTRILGVDYGIKRIGLALSDEKKIIASPLSTLQAENKSEQTVTKFLETMAQLCQIHRCQIAEIVVGLPLMMSGRTGFLADEVKHFVQLLTQASPIPVRLWDERLSTVQAERVLRESSLTRKRRSKVVDTVSAAIILQSYLDSKIISSTDPSI